MSARGYLIPAVNAVVRVDEARTEVSTSTWSASFDGVLAGDIAGIADGQLSARLTALARINPTIAALSGWTDHTWLALTALDSIRLDGFDTLFVEVVGQCNERCQHCYAESGPTIESALERQTCEAIVDDARALGFRRIQFTGGDPLLCPFLPELVERARSFESREIYTNGLALTEELLAKLAPHDPSFAFSYYSHDPAIHDAITRTPGSLRRTRAAIARVVARKLPVRASIVVFNENVDSIDATVEDLKGLGVESIGIAASKTAGRGRAFAWQPRTQADGGHRPSSMRSEGRLCVTYEGMVVPCIFNRSRILGAVSPSRRLRDIVNELALTPGPAADADKLTCTSCRLTDFALATLGGVG